ncbi:MAG: flagellar basal body-associated FliL family protein [Armatimonadota bacterium]|nr:flagellar basal body-associated FliL family protein [bacterium]
MRRNSGLGKMVLIIILAVVVLLGGIGFMAFKGKAGKKHEKVKLPTTEMTLGEFVVNLADTNQVRYLKTIIVIDVEGAVKSEGGEKEASADPKLRDAVIEVLSSKCFSDLNQPGGKEKLKKDIITAVNKRLEEAKAVDVYFSEFAMQ